MPIYQYLALDVKGKAKKGTVDADTARDARDKLRRRDLRVTTMDQVKVSTSRAPGEARTRKFRFERKVNIRELAIVTRQFSTLLSSGVHLSEALTALVEQVEDSRMEIVLRDVREKIVAGAGLAEAFSYHPSFFSAQECPILAAWSAFSAVKSS